MATAVPTHRPHGKRSAQARSWKPGRRRQPSGARERWKPEWGETPQVARCATRTTARPAMFLAGDAQPSRLDAQAHAPGIGKQARQRLPWSGRSGAAGSAVFEGRQASRGGDSPQGFPLEASEARSAAGAKAWTPGAAEKKCAALRGTTHRSQRGAISSPPAPSSTATARSRQARQRRKPARPRSAR